MASGNAIGQAQWQTLARWALSTLAAAAVAWTAISMPSFPAKRSIKRPGTTGIVVTPVRPHVGAKGALHSVLAQKPMTLVEQAFLRFGQTSGQARWSAHGAPAGGIPMAPIGQPSLRPSAHHWHLAPDVPPGWGQP